MYKPIIDNMSHLHTYGCYKRFQASDMNFKQQIGHSKSSLSVPVDRLFTIYYLCTWPYWAIRVGVEHRFLCHVSLDLN